MKAEIEKLRQEAIDRYISNNFDLTRDVEIELSDVNGYHGREILELLQNIDDVFERNGNHNNAKPVIADIEYMNNVLTISNTGTRFDYEGIKALVFGHISTKGIENIGSKGSGFRSVLNWSKKVEIFSGGYKVRFSEDYARNEFEKVANKENIIIQSKQQLSKEKEGLCFPILSMPQYIEDDFESQFDTVIKIYIEDELNVGDYSLENQLNKLDEDYRTLLFLPNLNQISIKTKTTSVKYIKEIASDKLDLIILKKVHGDVEIKESYYSKKKSLKNIHGNKYLLIAVPVDIKLENYSIYSYFPTKEKSPFPVLLHAPFILSSDRNYIPTDNKEYNKELFKVLIVMLIEMANELISSKFINNNSIQATEIITPNNLTLESWKFQGKFGDFNLEHFFFDKVKDAKVFPLINGGYTGIINGIKRIKQKVPDAFKCDTFKNLLAHFDTEEENNLVTKIAEMNNININFTSEELCDVMEQINEVSISNNIDMFMWWNEHYSKSPISPKLLKDSSGSLINYDRNDKIFLPTDTGINTLPSDLDFVTLVVLSIDYTNEFIRQIQSKDNLNWELNKDKYDSKTNDKRILASYSEKYKNKFTEQSSREIIVRSVNDQVKDSNEAGKVILWLYSIYNQGYIQNDEWIKKIPYRLPAENGIEAVNYVYIGDNWNNDLGSKLFCDSKYKQFVTPQTIGINDEEVNMFTEFLMILGVKKYPEIKKTYFENHRFRSYLEKKINFGFNLNYIYTYVIDDFENIIKKLNTNTIVEWVNQDQKIRELLLSLNRDTQVTQQSNWTGEYLPSNVYIMYVLNLIQWIEINGKKYKPNQIVTYEKIKTNVPNLCGINETELKEIIGNDLFKLLDFNDSLGTLSSQQINDILFKLPDFDKTGEISRKLYLEIIRNKQNIQPSKSYNTKDIKVLCKSGKYIDSINVKYADKKYPRKVEEANNFIWIHPKQSAETIKNWLGVSRFEMTMELVNKVEHQKIKKDFELEINDLKVAILSIIETSNETNINRIRNVKIVPCLEIETRNLHEDIMSLDNYLYIEEDNVQYIKIPRDIDNISMLIDKTEFSSAIYEIFKYYLTLELDEGLVNWLVSKNHYNRKKIISDRYGTDKWNDTYRVLNKSNLLDEKICNWFTENSIDSDLFSQIKKFDFSNSASIDFVVLIDALKSISKNIKDINKLDETLFINVKDYWRQKVKRFIESFEERYKVNLYGKLLNKDKSKQEMYLSQVKEFGKFQFNDDEIPNDIIFDYEKKIIQKFNALEAKFNIDIKLEEIYSNNLMKIDSKVNDNRFNDYINENHKLESLIYFLSQEYEELIIKDFNETFPPIDNNEKSDPVEEEKIVVGTLTDRRVEPRITKSTEPYNFTSKPTTRTRTTREKSDMTKLKNGRTAEKMAYIALLAKYPTLKWTSENADKGLPERNKSTVFDMYYINSKGKVYVEIKALSNEFYMSASEYEFAKENKDSYELYFVDLDKKEILAPMKITEFENVKTPTEYKFSIKQNQ